MTKNEELVEALTDLMRAVVNSEACPESMNEHDRLMREQKNLEALLDRMALHLLVEPPAQRYTVTCDDCKAEIRETDSLQESAAGGRCPICRQAAGMPAFWDAEVAS